MITLIDIAAVTIKNYFGIGTAIGAYDITLDALIHYRDNCEHTAVCGEGGSLLRKEWYPEYKAQRKPLPQDALDALKAVEQQVTAWGIPMIKCPGYEADDVIATLATQAWFDDVQVLGSEKDLYQLISDNVRLIGKNGTIGPVECVNKFGVNPAQMRDYLALCGDASDNVPGCPGIGPGRARDLLQKFETIDGIMAATDEQLRGVRGIGDKALASLREWDPALAVKLVSLLYDAPVSVETLWERKAG
jgi:DNA polymerase I